jgi:predicted nucleic acid-binding protein
MRWLARQQRAAVFITAITQAEVLCGVEALPPGKRRGTLRETIEKLLSEEFAGRILPFDDGASRLFAKIVAGRQRMGRPISQFDAMIAPIARSRDAVVATRNVGDFEHSGVQVIDPWSD